jgi:hypothetical protein
MKSWGMISCNGCDVNSTNCPNTMQRNEKKCWSCNDPRCQKIIISQEGDDIRLAINDPKIGSSQFHGPIHQTLTAYPLAVVDIGLKSVRPDSTKWRRTSGQSSRESHEILLGGSTSTGITWEMPPHCTSITRVPIPPLRRQRSSRRLISAATSGSWLVTYVRETICVFATEKLHVGRNQYKLSPFEVR